MVKRNLSKPETHVSPTRSPSPAKKTPKKPCAKETQRSLRFGSKRSEEVVDTVDLTDSEEQTRKSLVRKTRTKMELKSTNKRSLLPTDDSDPEQIVGVSPRRRLRTNSLTKHSNKTKESPERSRISSTRRHTLGSQDNLQGAGSSKKSHLRSSSHHNLSPRSVNNSRSYSMKKEGESDVMTRSKTGTIPKAAIPSGFPNPNDPARLIEPECEISEELRFTTQVQYIHKMADRQVGGVELDLPSVSAAIRSQGGLQSVINKNKWLKVAENMRIPKAGRSKPLSEFFRVARNTQSMWFSDDEPTADQVEVAHIDTKHCGSAFPAKKDSPYARHGWNYNILQHHPSSVLRHLGQVTGLTVPMLHIGMVFSTSCWARDPHFLPYMVYSHTGADVICEETKFKQALEDVAPKLIDAQSPIWLPEDSVMYQGEFVIVFPKAFTATVTCGYNISESLHFATAKWLPLGYEAAQLLYASGEPDLFSMEKLLYLLATDDKTPTESLQILLPLLETVVEEELHLRKRLGEAGLQQAKKVSRIEAFLTSQDRPRRSVDLTSHEENRCDSSSKICYFSTVVNEAENIMFALQDALLHIKRKKNLRNCKLLYRFDQKELKDLIQQVKTKVTFGRSSGKRKSSKNR
ncbi:hypothetical protein LSH36_676g01067 [Paralvinella palmiformis]|uniref:JmjC domain-containing protein n=1 Tax=Paralvinella palmiformis TaxID=53620 RepID=A0AAD9MVN0_9ANNE|nr:hypothetical protein LSH36_676g01067 [Paralvinella palmiformis]